MRRFSKILFLLLALVAIVTAFTVVALANGEEPAIEAAPAKFGGDWDFTFESYDHNQQIQNSASKKGKFTVIKQDVDNKYVFIEYEAGTGTNAENLDFDWTTRLIADYKYLAMDFDVMSPDGGHSAGLYFRLRDTNYKSGVTGYDLNLGTKVTFSSLGISTTPYDWQHVTVIVELMEDFTFSYHVYVNGKFVKTISDSKWTSKIGAAGFDTSKLAINYARILSQSKDTSARDAVDNIRVTHYKEGASFDQIANYYYKNGEYELPYKYTVATVTDAEGNVSYFDDIKKAIAAAAEDDTVQLHENVTETVLINKAITVDSNIYSTDAETGETTVTGTYAFEWGSTEGYVAELADGVYTITKSTQLVTVKWDAPCAEDCTCVGNHQLKSESIVIINETPEFFYELPETSEVKGLVTTFLGWSYENDGTVDTLVPITADDVDNGTINLYPVYSQAQYDFSLTVDGEVTYYTALQFAEVVAAVNVADNVERTVTLLRDATVFEQMVLNVTRGSKYVKVVFDLRGNTLTSVKLTGNKLVYNKETGEYDSTAITPSSAFAFAVPSGGGLGWTHLTVTSSAEEKGNFVTYKLTGDVYLKDGEIEKYDATAISSSHFIHMYNSKNYKCNVSNINVYAGRFLYASGGSNTGFIFNLDNCNYYETSSSVTADMKDSYTFYFESNSSFTTNITNSLFYYPEGLAGTNVFMRCYGKSGGVHNVTVENCDIIGMTSQDIFNFYSNNMTTTYITPNVQFNNCRLYNVNGNATYTTYLGEDTLYTSTLHKDSTTTVSAGYVSTPVTNTETYTVPVSTAPVIDAETKQPGFSADTTTLEISYAYEVKKCSEVPESLTDVRFAMFYYTNFNMVLYVPVTEATDVSLTKFTQMLDEEGAAKIVKIDGESYYVFTKESGTATVSDTVTSVLTYKVDGKSYRQTFNVNALVYADIILNDPIEEVETKAVANMVRYIKEARLASGLEAGAEFDNLIALGNLADLGAKEDYADTTVDYSGLNGYVSTIQFMIDGTNAAYVITLTDTAVSAGAVVSVSYVDGEEIALNDSTLTANAKYTSGTRIYDIAAKSIKVTVTVGEETFTGTYSAKAYINATDNALAKAMYEFGVAAKAYRDYLIEA